MNHRTAQADRSIKPPPALHRSVAGPATNQLRALSRRLNTAPAVQRVAAMAPANRTGLPDGLKAGIENLSGMSMDAVRVHRNSAKPAQLNAHAYAQGTDIHLAPGQEQHLPHEAWHVVQQAQGRVRPTMQMKTGQRQAGAPVNDDPGLEREADVMGARAMAAVPQRCPDGAVQGAMISSRQSTAPHPGVATLQGVFRTSGLDVSDKALAAFRIFSAAIPDRSASHFLKTAPFVIIDFEVSRHLPEARGDTSKQVELFDDFVGDFGTAAGKLNGPENIRNKKTYVTIRLNAAFVANNSAPVIAKTLAHELGAHVAPFADIFRRAQSEEGLSEEDIRFMEERGHGKGAGDHAAIRNRKQLEYENIVRNMAVQLGGPKSHDAQDVVYHYILDISRYDDRGMPLTDSSETENQARRNLKKDSMAWALPYVQGHSTRPKGISATTTLILGLGILGGIVGAWLTYHRYFAEHGD